MLVVVSAMARSVVAAGTASFLGGDIKVDSEMADRSQNGRREVTELLEAALSAIMDKEAVGGVNMGRDFGVDRAIGLKQGVCIAKGCYIRI